MGLLYLASIATALLAGQRPQHRRFAPVCSVTTPAKQLVPFEVSQRRSMRWRAASAWARWERAKILRHLSETEQSVLRDVLVIATNDTQISEHDERVLLMRLEIADVLLNVRADGAAVCAAFEAFERTATNATLELVQDAAALAVEIRALRVGLGQPLLLADPAEHPITRWRDIDEKAALVRRTVAVSTKDARALLAELAAVVVALRRSEATDLHGRAVALQAVHVHLPLAELLRLADRPKALFAPRKYTELLREIEDRAYSTLFPEAYELLRQNALRAYDLCDNIEVFAAKARRAIARALADDRVSLTAFFDGKPVDGDLLDCIERRLVVTARVKSPGSALRKILRRGSAPAGIHDLIGLRVVILDQDRFLPEIRGDVDLDDQGNVAAAYSVYRAVRRLWPEVEDRFKDYIVRPKESGYQALHATCWLADIPMEVQIRTHKMHTVAETGAASHAVYSGTRRDASLATDLVEAPLHARRLLPGGTETLPLEGDDDDVGVTYIDPTVVANDAPLTPWSETTPDVAALDHVIVPATVAIAPLSSAAPRSASPGIATPATSSSTSS